MIDRDKVFEYEVHIENMLHVLQDRLDEFGDGKDLSDSNRGAIWRTLK